MGKSRPRRIPGQARTPPTPPPAASAETGVKPVEAEEPKAEEPIGPGQRDPELVEACREAASATAGRLYKTREGLYSATQGAPYIQGVTIAKGIDLGLFEDNPSAGNFGGCTLTDAGRSFLP